jgi:cobalt transporter subunit CbtB
MQILLDYHYLYIRVKIYQRFIYAVLELSGRFMSVNETVSDRIELAHSELTPTQIVAGVVFGAAIVFTLLFLQEPLAHDATHNFRHAAGIVCH